MGRAKKEFPNKRIDVVSPSLTYIGNYGGDLTDPALQDADPMWEIERIFKLGTVESFSKANGGAFNNVWNDRASLFPAIPFPNTHSLNMDGVDEYVDLGDNYTFGPATSFSYSMWVKPQNVSAQRCLISKSTNDGNVYGYMFYHGNTGKIIIQCRASGTLRLQTFTTELVAAVWSNVVITYDGSSNMNGFKVYINGVLDATTPASATLNAWTVAEPLKFGRRSNSFHYSGKCNNYSCWDKALSQADVDEIYNGGTPADLDQHGSKTSLLSWWKLNADAAYPTESDQKGNIDGTLVNMELADYVEDAP
jgi:hypothetical protein